jgi:hypothetical protein
MAKLRLHGQRPPLVRLKAHTNREVKVPSGQNTGCPKAEGNCVVERRGGEQPEANYQSTNTKRTKLNSIRPDALASLLAKGEAWNRMPTPKGQGDFGALRRGATVSASAGMHGVVGGGTVRSWSDVNQGSRAGERNGVHGQVVRRTDPEGDRAFVVARKQGNACGAKGGREVEYEEDSKRETPPPSVPVRALQGGGPHLRFGDGHPQAVGDILSAESFAKALGALSLAPAVNRRSQ